MTLRPARPSRLDWTHVAFAAALVLLLYLVAVPVGYMVVDGLTEDGPTLANVHEFFADRKLLAATGNSVLVALGVAVLSVLIGAPLAFGVVLTDMPGKFLVKATIVTSLISPDFLIAMAYVALAGPNAGYFNRIIRDVLGIGEGPGPLNVFSLWGLVLTALPHGVAFVFMTLAPALRNLDPALDDAARLHGASARRAIIDVALPLMRPALLGGALLAFASSLAMYGPPHMLRLSVLTISIREALLRLDFKSASVASLVLVLLSIAALGLYRLTLRRGERYRTLGGKSFNRRPLAVGHLSTAIGSLGIAYALVALIVPYGGMLMVSAMKSVGQGIVANNWTVDNYATVFDDLAVRKAAVLSGILAAATATLVVALGFVVAYVSVRTRVRGRSLLDYLAALPVAIPGTALAIALIVVYLHWPLNLLGFYGSFGILFVAYLARFVPYGVRSSQVTLLQMTPDLEEASRLSGAGPLTTIGLITLPIVRRALVYGWVLVFILALPELSASVILKGIHTQTLATVLLDIWNGNGGLAVASALGMTLFLTVGGLLLLAAVVGGRADRDKVFQLGA